MLIKRLNYLSHLIRVSLWLTLSSICFYSLYGQNDRLASLNPSDLFLQTYIYERDGKALISDSKYDAAIEKFSKATHLLNTLHVNYPTWRPDYVKKAYDRVAVLTQETLKAKESESSPSSATPSLYSEGEDSGERAKERAQDILKNDKRLSEITKRLADIQEQIDNKQSKLKEEASRNEVIADLKKKDAELSAVKERSKKEKSDFEKRQKALTSEVNILRIQLDENANKQQQKEADFKDELLSAIRSKNAEIALLEKNTSEIQGENKAHQEALHKEISSLKSELKEMSTVSSGLKQKEQEASKLKEELTSLRSENETISAQQQESDKARKSIEGRLASLNFENKQLKKSLGNAGSSFVQQVDDLNKQMLALKQERDLVEASKNESIANIEKLTQLLAKEKSAHLAEIQEQKTNINRLTEKVEDLSTIDTKNAENDLLKKNASEMQAKAKVRQEALNEEISTLRSALKDKYDDNLDFKQKELEASKLKEELISLRGENESIAEQQRESEKARKKLEGALASVDQENEQLKASLKNTVDSFGNQVDTLNKEKLSLKKERNYAAASRDESFANVKKLTQLLEKEKGVHLLETEKNRAEYLANIQVQEKRINALNQKIKDLGKNHKSIRQESDDEIASLKSQAEGNLRLIASLQGKLQTALKSADEQEAYSKQKILTFNQSLKDASKQQDHSLIALQDASDTNVKLQDQITALQQEKSILLTRPLRSEIEALQEDLQDTENAKESLSLNLSRNEAKYFTALDRIKKLQTELETSRVVASKLEISFDEEREMSSVVIKSQRERLTQLNNELAQVNRQLASEEAKVIQLQKLVDETKEHYKDVKGKYENLLV